MTGGHSFNRVLDFLVCDAFCVCHGLGIFLCLFCSETLCSRKDHSVMSDGPVVLNNLWSLPLIVCSTCLLHLLSAMFDPSFSGTELESLVFGLHFCVLLSLSSLGSSFERSSLQTSGYVRAERVPKLVRAGRPRSGR